MGKGGLRRCSSITLGDRSLGKAWADLLALRKPGFCFTGGDYLKPSRNQSCDAPGLLLHKEPLLRLLRLTPNGYPSLASLRKELISIDAEYDVLQCTGRNRFKVAGESADRWRKMCRDVRELAKSGVFPDELAPLVDCIDLRLGYPPTPGAGDSTPVQSEAIQLSDSDHDSPASAKPPPGSLPPVADDGDCHIVGVVCMCPECVQARDVPLVVVPSQSSASTSHWLAQPGPSCDLPKFDPILIEADIPIPSPLAGGQRKLTKLTLEVVSHPVPKRRRLRTKQPAPLETRPAVLAGAIVET